MRSRLREEDESVPDRYGPFVYFTRTQAGRQYPIVYRRPVHNAQEEILLDINTLAEGHAFTRIGVFRPTHDGRLLAWSVDVNGSETYTLFIKDLTTGALLDRPISNTYYGVAWSNDGQYLFYTTLDDARRPYRVYRHAIGSDPEADTLVYEETDHLFHVDVSLTRSRAYILVTSHSNTTSEVYAIPADEPTTAPRLLLPRRHRVEYTAHHCGDHFYFLTNDNALNFRVLRTPVDDARLERMEEIIPHRNDVMIDDIALFADHLVAYERADARERVEIIDLRTGEAHLLTFPEQVYTLQPWDRDALWEPNLEFDTAVLRLHVMSLTQPRTIYDYDMTSRVLQLVKRDDIPGYDPSRYRSERLWATAGDGVRIPISIVYRADVTRPAPLLLYGYGSYGATADPRFSLERISLLDRGVIFAIAHVRGGGELGRAWYEAGKMLNKRNTFTDFIACAEHLIAGGYTTPERLAIMGRSAGRSHNDATGSDAVRDRRCSVRRCDQHHARSVDPADGNRVRRMGKSGDCRTVRIYEVLFSLRQHHAACISGNPGDRRLARSACAVLGTRQMGGKTARGQNERHTSVAEDRNDRRACRSFRAL
jgi:oligopeptidase B